MTSGGEVLERYSFGNETAGEAMLALFLMILGFNFLAYLALLLRRRKYKAMASPEEGAKKDA